MKSTIKIDLGENNLPVIKLNIAKTDDVRDILVNQFKESLGYNSNLVFLEFTGRFPPDGNGGTIQEILLHPISAARTEEFIKLLCPAQIQTLKKYVDAAYDPNWDINVHAGEEIIHS